MAGEERSAEEVFEDHLRESAKGTVEEDLARNYARDIVALTGSGVYRGHDGIRVLAKRLQEELPGAQFHYGTQLIEDEFAFLEWAAESRRAKVQDGADSYWIRDGRIIAQTIHYTVKPCRQR